MSLRFVDFIAGQSREFLPRRQRSAALAARSANHWLNGVPLHWMADWGTPHPLFVGDAAQQPNRAQLKQVLLASLRFGAG